MDTMSVRPGSDNGAPDRPLQGPGSAARFLTLGQVSEELSTSNAQIYALVRTGALRAIKIGGRGQWRVARSGYLGVGAISRSDV